MEILELKNTMTKMKTLEHELNSRKKKREKASKLKDKAIEFTQSEHQRKDRLRGQKKDPQGAMGV